MVINELMYELSKLIKQDIKVLGADWNIWTMISFLAISYGFMFYHLSAKGLNNTPALISVFVFGFVSLAVVKIEKQGLGAVLMHIINNSVAILLVFGIKLAS